MMSAKIYTRPHALLFPREYPEHDSEFTHVWVCVRACVRACVSACVRACACPVVISY